MEKLQLFNVGIGVIHSVAELVVVSVFLHNGQLAENLLYSRLHVFYFFLLMGVGGLIHSLVDFSIAYFFSKYLK